MKSLYEVTATKSRRVKTVSGYSTPEDGYLVHKSYQIARSETEAIKLAKLYITDKYTHIRASYVRKA